MLNYFRFNERIPSIAIAVLSLAPLPAGYAQPVSGPHHGPELAPVAIGNVLTHGLELERATAYLGPLPPVIEVQQSGESVVAGGLPNPLS